MKALWRTGCLLALLLGLALPVRALELSPSINTASLIEFPTALDQRVDNTLHASVELVDVGEPDLRAENVRYGHQVGNLQALLDVHILTEPERKFDYAEARAKLRVFNLDRQRTYVALGALARLTEDKEGEARIDHRPYSLLLIITTELLPTDKWGGFLTNFYLDNRFANLGFKVQLYDQLKAVAEVDYLHSTDVDDRFDGKVGIEIEGEQNFYLQLYYKDSLGHALLQIGTSF